MEIALHYQTGEELLTLKDELFEARERILATHPDLKQECTARIAYSKYTHAGAYVNVTSPSLVRYVSVGAKKSRLANDIPKKADEFSGYVEYFFSDEGEFLGCRQIWKNETSSELFAVDFDGYKYVFNADGIDERNFICRMKFKDKKLLAFDEFNNGMFSGSWYYSEIYYQIDGKNLCTALSMSNEFEMVPKYEKYINETRRPELQEMLNKKREEFYERLKLPVTEKLSPVSAYAYELAFDEKNKLAQIDEITLFNGKTETIFPRKKKTPSGLPKTRDGIKTLKQKLKDNGYTSKNGVAFKVFWETFKEFCLKDKYDCADDDILFEPTLYEKSVSIHVARQFCHEDAYGQYEKMEQLNIDFDVEINSFADCETIGTVWSEKDFEKFFAEVENGKEFKSVPPEKLIKPYMYFGEV